MTDSRASAPPPEPEDPGADAVPHGPEAPRTPAAAPRRGVAASVLVASGILLSRIAGLVRTRVLAMYFGTSLYADVFNAGLRMPNVLQNLLGEGTLSASFIPVYAELLQQGRKEEAGRVAGAVFSLLLALAAGFALVGVALAPLLTTIFLPGFEGERRELTIEITRILFPMTGVLVLSAWSLGILNSHRYFFLSYFAPVLWNASIIGALLLLGGDLSLDRLVVAAAWGALIGGVLQFAIQLPGVLRLERSLRIDWYARVAGAKEAVRNAIPAVMGRGVVQISSWADTVLASFLAAGAVATLGYALTLYVLPVSLFGMSVAAAELPELSRERERSGEVLRERASGGLERIAFYVIPSFVGFLFVGDAIVAGIFQTGQFDAGDTLVVWATLAAFSVGLLATTASRMLSSTFFALRDTKTPARYATLRVVVSILLGVTLMLQFETVAVAAGALAFTIPGGVFSELRLGGAPLGPVGLGLGSGIAAWVEWALLKRALRRRIGPVRARPAMLGRMWVAALAGAAAAYGVERLLPGLGPIPRMLAVVGTFGAVYFAIGGALGLEQAGALFRRALRIVRRR